MAITDFESELDLGLLAKGTLRGGITGVTVKERDVVGTYQDTHIIRTDREWQVTINWELVGSMLDSPFFTIPGKWVVRAYLEGWGKDAEERDLEGDTVGGIAVVPALTIAAAGSEGPGTPPETEWRYVETFTFPVAAAKPGPYRLAVTINYKDATGAPGPMAGFIEIGDMVQLYEPGP